jgi:hypothetical protein
VVLLSARTSAGRLEAEHAELDAVVPSSIFNMHHQLDGQLHLLCLLIEVNRLAILVHSNSGK